MPRAAPARLVILTLVAACASSEDDAVAPGSTTTTGVEPAPTGEPPTTAPAPDVTTGPDGPESTSTTGTTGPDDPTTATTKQPAPGCGDGIVDPDTEQCDLGHGLNSDAGACTLTCEDNVCGDGLKHDGVEACDAGVNNNDAIYGHCGTNCEISQYCGDSQVQGPEECDLGANNGRDVVELGGVACDATCRFAAKLVFLTSAVYKPHDLGSAEEADLQCRVRASAAGYDNPDSFMAWISDDASSPVKRFTPSSSPYVLPNGVRVADDFAALQADGPLVGITRTELDEDLLEARVWTATGKDGALYHPSLDCKQWDSISFMDQAMVGRSGVDPQDEAEVPVWKLQFQWTNFLTRSCNHEYHLYCFEQ